MRKKLRWCNCKNLHKGLNLKLFHKCDIPLSMYWIYISNADNEAEAQKQKYSFKDKIIETDREAQKERE